jgi:hypothetical protein
VAGIRYLVPVFRDPVEVERRVFTIILSIGDRPGAGIGRRGEVVIHGKNGGSEERNSV